MTGRDLLVDAFGRIPEMVHGVLEGLTPEELAYRADRDANSIAWLIWHLSRIEDHHISEVAARPQLWTSGGWAGRWKLPFDEHQTGYGHSSRQVGLVSGDPTLLRGYFDEVHEMTMRFARSLRAADLDRVVDRRWHPPVTLGVRLVSVATHDFEQIAQAAFVRGLLDRM